MSPAENKAPAYNDAEKGLIDVNTAGAAPLAVPLTQQAPKYQADEKKADLTAPVLFPLPKEKKETPSAPPAKPSPKKRKKVSKWILFKLWFNTYR